jgi:hypothetical protein
LSEYLPEQTADDTDVDWGEAEDNRDDWYLAERPPHHEG